jgi:hypothetical protein
MKIKFPKTINIGTKVFKVTHDSKLGGEFEWNSGTLRICDKKSPEETLNIITHEIFEIWTVALYLRYERPDTYSSYEFHFDHQHFTNLCEMASKTLSEFIK